MSTRFFDGGRWCTACTTLGSGTPFVDRTGLRARTTHGTSMTNNDNDAVDIAEMAAIAEWTVQI